MLNLILNYPVFQADFELIKEILNYSFDENLPSLVTKLVTIVQTLDSVINL